VSKEIMTMQLWALLVTSYLPDDLYVTTFRPMGPLSRDVVECVAKTIIEEVREDGDDVEVRIVPNGVFGELH
jgi:hypothetical protein